MGKELGNQTYLFFKTCLIFEKVNNIWYVEEGKLEKKINYPHSSDFLKQYHLSQLRGVMTCVGLHVIMLKNCIDHYPAFLYYHCDP